jgi:hypothetical protein
MRKVSEKDVLELLESRVISLKSELKRAEDALIALKGSTNGHVKNDIDRESKRNIIPRTNGTSNFNRSELPLVYDSNHKWDKKILFVLAKAQTAFKEDIVKEISTLEPVQNSDKLTNLIGVKLSALLKQDIIKAKREGKKFKYQLHAV